MTSPTQVNCLGHRQPNEPKMLTGSSQNRQRSRLLLRSMEHTDIPDCRCERQGLNHSCHWQSEHVNPTSRLGLPRQARPQGTLTGMAGRGCWKKRRPFCNGADRSCNITRRASGLTSSGSFVTRELAEPSQEEKQMNVEQSACASSGKARSWEQLTGPNVNAKSEGCKRVSSRQHREGRWGKVKALQRLLTCSFSGKALAVKRVTENQGKRTPGVDGAIWALRRPNTKPSARCGGAGIRPQPLAAGPYPEGQWKVADRWASRR
jgi:hypothetical protein